MIELFEMSSEELEVHAEHTYWNFETQKQWKKARQLAWRLKNCYHTESPLGKKWNGRYQDQVDRVMSFGR